MGLHCIYCTFASSCGTNVGLSTKASFQKDVPKLQEIQASTPWNIVSSVDCNIGGNILVNSHLTINFVIQTSKKIWNTLIAHFYLNFTEWATMQI